MIHKVKGCLVRHDMPWWNDTVISEDAFKWQDGTEIPVFINFTNRDEAIGKATLMWDKKGIYYSAEIEGSEEIDRMFNEVESYGWRLGLYANQIEQKNNIVTFGKIQKMAFARKTDDASYILEVDGETITYQHQDITIRDIIGYLTKKAPKSFGQYIEYDSDRCACLKFYYYERLGWCGCGEPGTALEAIKNYLEILSEPNYEKRSNRLKTDFKLLGDDSDPLCLCLAYTLDAAGFTEHGSSVYSAYLTKDGEYFLWLLQEAIRYNMLDDI